MSDSQLARIFLPILSLLTWSGCTQKMAIEGHLRPDSSVRPIPADTIAWNQAAPVSAPSPGTRPTLVQLQRGRERFTIYCSPCHGYSGHGDGMIVKRGFLAPPTFHQERLRSAPDQHFYDVISQGYGAMYSYATRVNQKDRWAIVAYIRALQRSQNIRWEDLNPAEREKLSQGK